MKQRWCRAVVVVGLFAGCATDQASKPVPPDLNVVAFEQNLYF